MTFGKPRFNKNYEWELIRYATAKHIIGGAGKLLKYFERNYKPKSIITYADRRFSQGNMYYKLGFTTINFTEINYWWITDDLRLSRYQTQKHKFKNILKSFDNTMTECENLVANRFLSYF